MASPPNLVFVMADQLRRAACGFAGDARAHTPRLDDLATQGVEFTQAVATMPVCSAMRASLARRMAAIGDTFERSTWYRDNWVSDDRHILRTATVTAPPPPAG